MVTIGMNYRVREGKEAVFEAAFARVLDAPDAVEAALAEGAAAVAEPQVPVRPGELPLFVHDDEGRRRKLVRDGDRFALKKTDVGWSAAELRALLAREPARFSPAVLLRPVLQDYLLPTTAYVAGPAEARYHAQLGPLYRLFEVARPRLLPRPRFTLLEPRVRRALEKLGVSADEALEHGVELGPVVSRRRAAVDPEAAATRTREAVLAAVAELREQVVGIDPGGLAKAFDDAEKKLAFQIDKLGQRGRDALARKDKDTAAAAGRVLALLAPNGQPQERVFGPLYPLSRTSADELVRLLLARIDPKDPGRHQFVDLP